MEDKKKRKLRRSGSAADYVDPTLTPITVQSSRKETKRLNRKLPVIPVRCKIGFKVK
jgi:hypothetical protein